MQPFHHLWPRRAETEREPVARHRRQRECRLGRHRRRADAELEHAGPEQHPRGPCREVPERAGGVAAPRLGDPHHVDAHPFGLDDVRDEVRPRRGVGGELDRRAHQSPPTSEAIPSSVDSMFRRNSSHRRSMIRSSLSGIASSRGCEPRRVRDRSGRRTSPACRRRRVRGRSAMLRSDSRDRRPPTRTCVPARSRRPSRSSSTNRSRRDGCGPRSTRRAHLPMHPRPTRRRRTPTRTGPEH